MAEPIFDAPIPGSSLTKETGSQSYKSPPQYTKVDEAIDFYIERMATEEFSDKLVSSLKLGVSVAQIANIMQIHGVMEGQHTLDISMLILPVLMEFIRLIADTRGIEYDMGIDDYDPNVADDALISGAVRKLKKANASEGVTDININEFLDEEEVMLPIEKEDAPLNENMAMGLMSRGI